MEMFQFDGFIFSDEVIRIIFLFLFVYILLCIYFSPFFSKSNVFSIVFYKKQFEVLLQFKFNKNLLKKLKDKFLKISGFILLLYIIKTKTVTLETFTVISNSLNLNFLEFFCFSILCIYIGYIKVKKKETYLFLRFEIFYLFMPFIFFLEGYYCIGFFILYPFYKLSDFFFTCLFKYFENLYYNLLPKFNLFLAFFIWLMLKSLEKINKYQVLFENFSFAKFLLIFSCFLFIFIYLKINKKMSFLVNAYLSCINFFVVICVFFVFLIEKLKKKFIFFDVLKHYIFDNLNPNYEICFIMLFFFIGVVFIYNKNLFSNDKTNFFIFAEFFFKNFSYFFFNGFAIGRFMVGGIVKTTTEGIIDTNIVHAVENAKFEPLKSKPLIIPKTQEEFVVFVADNATEIRKNPEIRNECIKRFKYYKTNDEAFKLVTQETYDELESGGKFLMLNGKRTILLGNLLPLWYPNIPHGPDAFLPSQDTIHQLKTGEKVAARNVVDMQNEYGEGMLKGSLLLNYFYVYIPEEERNKLLRRHNKCPDIFRPMLFTDITTLPPSKPEDFVLMKKIAIENEARLQQKRSEMLKEAIINPNRIRLIAKTLK